MLIIFCLEPFSTNRPDALYQNEVDAVIANNGLYELIDYEALVDDHNAKKAVAKIDNYAIKTSAIYRGWMLKIADYQALYNALAHKNIELINDVDAYQHCHYLPASYHLIKDYTASTVWLAFDQDFNIDKVLELLSLFDTKPIIIKDYVKSRKHEWTSACFIPSAKDLNHAKSVIETFLSRQAADLAGGIVLREYLDLQPLTIHSKSGMPLTREYRLFFFNQKLIYYTQYWEEGIYDESPIPLEKFINVAQTIKSHFFSMDIAMTTQGDWVIIELGDGQVAGLPERTDIKLFYKNLFLGDR